MRLKEPFEGYELISGTSRSHFIFLIGSFIIFGKMPFMSMGYV